MKYGSINDKNMRTTILIISLHCCFLHINAQKLVADTSENGYAVIHRDVRIDLLGKKMAEYNESLADKIQMVNGYRLLLLNTTDRNHAMQLRANMLQQFPEQKIYMVFISPYIKLKVGNFTDRNEAEKLKKQIIDLKLVSGNIYVLSEKVEQKPTEKTTAPKD